MSRQDLNNQAGPTVLTIIDPQMDFISGSLAVDGAGDDIARMTKMIEEHGDQIDQIIVSSDSHYDIDISHPAAYLKPDRTFIDPFTVITRPMIEQGEVIVRGGKSTLDILDGDTLENYVLSYIDALSASTNAYPLMVWPEHCIIDTAGHQMDQDLRNAIRKWERQRYKRYDPVVKGVSFFSEHYGILKADIEFAKDHRTRMDTAIATNFQRASRILLGGIAGTHCVLTSVLQIEELLGKDNLHKLYILEDCNSDIPETNGVDFPAIKQAQFDRLRSLGVNFVKAKDAFD